MDDKKFLSDGSYETEKDGVEEPLKIEEMNARSSKNTADTDTQENDGYEIKSGNGSNEEYNINEAYNEDDDDLPTGEYSEGESDNSDPDDEDEDLDAAEARESLMENVYDALIEFLDGKQYSEFVHALDDLNPVDAAAFFSRLPDKRLPTVFRLLKKDTAADVFAELDSDTQQKIITAMTDREISLIVEDLFLDDAVDMLEEMPANMVRRIMAAATPETRSEINRFLSYPEDSAGSIMTAEYIDLRAGMTCAEAIKHVRRTGIDKETVYMAYVIDARRILLGIVSFKELLFADPDDKVGDIMETDIISAHTVDDRETVAGIIDKYDLLALPITDNEDRLVGIVTVDDAIDVIMDEATEDIEKMAAIVPSDKPYLKTGVFDTWKKRIPWLLLLMVSATFTSTIITHYEAAIGAYAILTAFFPMLMDTGGNAGGQTSVTIIRGLSLGDITPKDIFRILFKEFRVSLLCGLTLSAATFIKVFAIDFGFKATTVLANGDTQNNLLIALVVCLTVFSAIVVAKLVGTLLPLGAKMIHLDPAVMASPFITTIVDTVTLIIYFKIASMFLPI